MLVLLQGRGSEGPASSVRLAGKRLQEAADELYEGELAPLLTHLVRSQKLSTADRANLRKMLDELEGKGPGKRK